ncbi:hypothetical protein ACN4EE_04465 [Geminocystis sp. CENA526]|uniref:hypothetical protein n=1 Tax=Geminocystis sp. CENA526 TaxID=1355871 RepID=UPI003D6EAB67
MEQIKLTSVIMSVLATLSIIPLAQKPVMAQAQVSGASVHFIPDPISGDYFIQTISGSVSIPTGSFNGLSVQPIRADLLPFPTPPSTIAPGPSNSNINGEPTFVLLLNPGGINPVSPTPITLNQQAAELLSNASNISEIVSIIRANSNFLRNPSTQQAVATGSTMLLSPDGLIQTASAEISLPMGLLFLGFNDNENTGGCDSVSGCLMVKPFVDNFTDPNTFIERIMIQELRIDPGPVGLANEPFDLATTAASVLNGQTNLSNIVSIIRAVSDANGVASPQLQARAMGAITVQNTDGTTISVSGEIALPAGLYFATADPNEPNVILPFNCVQAGGLGCMSIIPEYALLDVGGEDFVNVTLLTINPGEVKPGDPTLPLTGFIPEKDLNATAAFKIYENAGDITQLSDLVSIIRAGAGANGLTPANRPTARASGSATIVLPNGATQSVNAEMSLSNSLYFEGSSTADPFGVGYCNSSACLVIDPSINIDTNDVNQSRIDELVIDPGQVSAEPGWNFDAAAGYALSVAVTLSEQVSIIRAGGGLE